VSCSVLLPLEGSLVTQLPQCLARAVELTSSLRPVGRLCPIRARMTVDCDARAGHGVFAGVCKAALQDQLIQRTAASEWIIECSTKVQQPGRHWPIARNLLQPSSAAQRPSATVPPRATDRKAILALEVALDHRGESG